MYSRINHEFTLFTSQFSNLDFFRFLTAGTVYCSVFLFIYFLLPQQIKNLRQATQTCPPKWPNLAMIKLNLECQTSLFPIWENISKSITIIYRAIAILGKVSHYLILSQ